MPLTILQKAKKLFDQKKYSQVISLLEPNILQYRESFQFYLYLGLSCLHTGDAGGASSYFQRARQIKMRDPDLLTAQAALFLRRGETDQAVEYYLDALEYDPDHALAKKALQFIRKKGDKETFLNMAETGKITAFYPKPRRTSLHPAAVAAPLAVFILCASIFGIKAVSLSVGQETRADLSSISLQAIDLKNSVEAGGSYRYILTEKQVVQAFENSQRYFQSYRDNQAQVEINRILNSNASIAVRTKARLLMEYLSEPGFDTLKDNFSYATVIQDAYLYQDCWIRWKGMAANVSAPDDRFGFNFLVGYDTRSALEGIVPVSFDKPVFLDPSRPFELLAKIRIENGSLSLLGGGIYQSVSP
ncbi:tetratricopeptide repeat protein [Treponema zuelzerae]|uniref:Tetratricopeptide repeat protein n=1 Tax=Teretinema zuelzerae TaxID=156 RepID=A0AAE3EJ57_9SPIR|nr:tetratricopeptide repeat protein [Teretinema zuelzerae]MCD1654753.1 tetratricopeptide repeat protein [Teretinema zuelzerae]